jgi:hypothetical protein
MTRTRVLQEVRQIRIENDRRVIGPLPHGCPHRLDHQGAVLMPTH